MRPPTPSSSHHVEPGRRAFERRQWRAAHERLTRADVERTLGADDLWLLAFSAYLVGRDEEFVGALERAHQLHLEAGECGPAVRCAFWLGLHLAERGETARASGWFGRARRILESQTEERVEQGYLLLAEGHRRFATGDSGGAYERAGEAAELAQRFGDRDLLALGVHMQGRALLIQGRIEKGLALLDEAMVAVVTDELSPQVTGLVYCSVIGACRSVHAVSRAQEWTAALTDWCEQQPDMVAYSGECRVYRAELMQFHGAWRDALEEARRAGERVRASRGSAAALGLYQEGEAYRLMGQLAAAEKAYAAASQAGREPQPGLALLRLAQGEEHAAAAAIRRVLSETADPLRRAWLLPAHVEIMLAIGELEEARRSCDELQDLAGSYHSSVLEATAAHARGAVALAGGEPGAALPHLRRAAGGWHDLDAPYHAARTRALLGLACCELGDDDTGRLELERARTQLRRLGAALDVTHLDALIHVSTEPRTHGLTPRELEVLALVATGRTNRGIAEALFISEKTVARHLSNVFRKLGLSSRAAATAYAYEHHLVSPPT